MAHGRIRARALWALACVCARVCVLDYVCACVMHAQRLAWRERGPEQVRCVACSFAVTMTVRAAANAASTAARCLPRTSSEPARTRCLFPPPLLFHHSNRESSKNVKQPSSLEQLLRCAVQASLAARSACAVECRRASCPLRRECGTGPQKHDCCPRPCAVILLP